MQDMMSNQAQVYNFKPFRNSSHDKIIKLVEPNKKVLDVGCARGYIAAKLSEKNCSITGIDNNKSYLKQAKTYCDKTFLLDITKESIPGKYDVIILGDIIEHIPNPVEFLKSLRNNLNKEGYLIVSVPNIANIYPRLKIMLGNFDYENKGIFDKTHLRFFTMKSFKRAISKSGYTIVSFDSTPIPAYLAFRGLSKSLLSLANSFFSGLAKIWPKMFGYQFIAKIK